MKSDRVNQVYDYLERISNLIRMDARRAEPLKGLQPVQLEALHYLGSCNRYSNTPMAVADYLGLTKGTVSQTLSVLEASGLIQKIPDTRDRRVVHLVLTAPGQAFIDQAIPPKTLRSAVDGLPDAVQEQVVQALYRILQAMQLVNRLRSFGVCRTCRHHRLEGNGTRRCGLTQELLSSDDSEQICREHEPPEPRVSAG